MNLFRILMLAAMMTATAGASQCKGEAECKVCKSCASCWYCSAKNPQRGSCGVARKIETKKAFVKWVKKMVGKE